jgi:hypothetical protein
MKKAGLALIIGLLSCVGGYAQLGGPPRGGPGPHGEFGPGGFGFGVHPGKVVTGAPYSATATNVFTESLTGGNTIQRTTTAQVARDNQGRTYEQQMLSAGPLAQNGPITITFIFDPVAGYSYVLNPNTKVATRRAIKTPPAGVGPQFRGDRAGPAAGLQAGGIPAQANQVKADLGTQVMNGVTAQGKSVTRTIPAGAIGNAQPIVSTSETWYSPDLQVAVYATHNDPRAGVSTYSLTNIQRSEPSASLFQVPSDYTVQDAPSRHGPRGGAWGRPPAQ